MRYDEPKLVWTSLTTTALVNAGEVVGISFLKNDRFLQVSPGGTGCK